MQVLEDIAKQEKIEKKQEQVERILEWVVVKARAGEVKRTLMQKEGFEIIENWENEKIYCLTDFPELTVEEAWFINEVREKFMEEKESTNLESLLEKTLERYCENKCIELDCDQKEYLLKIIKTRVFGFGPVSKFLENENIEEIAVIGVGKDKPVYVYERFYGWLKTNVYFCNEDAARTLVNRMARSLGRRLSMQTPKINAVLPDGSRLHASINPISIEGPNLTIRKFRQKAFTPVELVELNTITDEALAFLWMLLAIDCSILICGNTGSGKTTTLNALASLIPATERIIVTEETPEIRLQHKHFVKINVVEELEVKMPDLIVDSLRMRPDRIIVGEIRNMEEVGAFVDTMLAGQGKGSLATFHAKSAEEALTRLKNLGVLEIDLAALDLIVVQRRWDDINLSSGRKKEVRHVTEIAEILSENGKVKLNTIFKFDFKKKKLVKAGESRRIIGKMCECFNCDRGRINQELKERVHKIISFKGKNLSMGDFFEIINREC